MMRRLTAVWWMMVAGLLCWALFQPARPALAASFTDASLSGSFAFQFNKFGTCPNIAVIVGVFDFNGAGNVTGSFKQFNSDKVPKVSSDSASGTYTVNSDGTGLIELTSPATTTFAFSIDSTATSAERIELINLTLGSLSCAESGYAIQQ
jgi:hypothetical protein